MKHVLFILTAFLIPVYACIASPQRQDTLSRTPVENGLKINSGNHYITDAKTRQPVFILATTAWNINALTYAEIDTLLQSVAGNGFNSIMFALDFYPQANEPNIYGQKAYAGADKTDLNPEYFAYCSYIVTQCTKLGIYPMIYTMWGGKTTGIMNNYTKEQLFTLGKKIGAHFKENRNVILVAGGESSPPYVDTARANAMGAGLKEGSEGNNLVTIHPTSPHSNSEFYGNAHWLDFYMSQGKSNINGISYDLTKAVSKDYLRHPVKPTMVSEHRYESGTTEDPLIQRRSMYLSVFAGGFGYAYGHNALWQMTPHTAQPWMLKSWAAGVSNWKLALNTAAAKQLHHIKTLLYSYPYFDRIPDQSLITSGQGDSIINRVQAMRNGLPGKNDATFIMLYISAAKPVVVNTGVIAAKKLNAYWFDPRTGVFTLIQRKFTNTGTFTAEKRNDGIDWVLVIDNGKQKIKVND